MKSAPKSLRLQIGIFGRTNVGKSSFLNLVAGQDVAITSPVPGTTTDVVEKTMELLPIGPVVFLDTAGLDDVSELSGKRIERAKKIYDRSDIIVLVTEPDAWTEHEELVVAEAAKRKIPVIVAVNKSDIQPPSAVSLVSLQEKKLRHIICSSIDTKHREHCLGQFKTQVLEVCPEEYISPPPLLGDLVPRHGTVILIIPIDIEAPKGRIILPQVQAIRDALDHDVAALVVKENDYTKLLANLKQKPDLVVCDSQVVDTMVADTPGDVACTTFSILFARWKGDLAELVSGAKAIDTLQDGDTVLIAESCSHHPLEDDIGRIKIPKWLKEYTKKDLQFVSCAGRDYPEDLFRYKLIVHCGSCMITRREMLARIQKANDAGVPITNYGVCIAHAKGVLTRVLAPFARRSE